MTGGCRQQCNAVMTRLTEPSGGERGACCVKTSKVERTGPEAELGREMGDQPKWPSSFTEIAHCLNVAGTTVTADNGTTPDDPAGIGNRKDRWASAGFVSPPIANTPQQTAIAKAASTATALAGTRFIKLYCNQRN